MANEQELVAALLEAADYRKKETRRVAIKRGGKVLFEFTISGLSEDEWQNCRRRSLKNRGKKNEELDGAKFLAEAIFQATQEKNLWNQREAFLKLNVTNGADVVNAVLLPAEKTRLAEIIEDLSGFNDEDNVQLDDEIKN